MKNWEQYGNEYYAKLQREILYNAYQLLSPGGMMLYSTCTFSPMEDEETVKFLLDSYPDMELVSAVPEEKLTEYLSMGFETGRASFMAEPVKKYFRLYPGNEVRLKSAYYITCNSYEQDENGNITCLHCTYDPESKGGETPDGRKVRGTIHWVSADNAANVEVRLYDRLFNVENPSDDSHELCEYLNPNSLEVLENSVVDKSLLDGLKVGDTFQFMRKGYYTVDKNSSDDKVIFNRTVDLNSSWK